MKYPLRGDNAKFLIIVFMIFMFTGMSVPSLYADEATPEPIMSRLSGVYTSTFSLSIETVSEARIYFTLDGTEPNEESTLYQGPIEIKTGSPTGIAYIPTTGSNSGSKWKPPHSVPFSGLVVRARAYMQDAAPSETVTRTYFLIPNHTASRKLPIISLVTEPDGMFSAEDGIYVPGIRYNPDSLAEGQFGLHQANYMERGMMWEREAFLEFFEPGLPASLSQNVGIRIHGSWSRGFPLKSLRIYARSEYGDGTFNHTLFGIEGSDIYKRFLLRSGGQDYSGSLIRDGLSQLLVRDLHVFSQGYRPCLLFINGVFWGIHGIQEYYSAPYFEQHAQIPEEQLVLLENNGVMKAGQPSDIVLWRNYMSFVRLGDFQRPEQYEKIQTMMDIDNFIDVWLISIITGNKDWPGNNVQYFRIREPMNNGNPMVDGRWRWVINDLDAGFRSWDHLTWSQGLAMEDQYPHPEFSTVLFRKLMENGDFREQLLLRLDFLLNTTFRTDRILIQLDELYDLLKPWISAHIERWGYPLSLQKWENEIEIIRRFAQERESHVRREIESYLKLPESLSITFHGPSGSSVQINGISLSNSNPEARFFYGSQITIDSVSPKNYVVLDWGSPSLNDLMMQGKPFMLTENLQIRPAIQLTSAGYIARYSRLIAFIATVITIVVFVLAYRYKKKVFSHFISHQQDIVKD
jgi:hypothetical protein